MKIDRANNTTKMLINKSWPERNYRWIRGIHKVKNADEVLRVAQVTTSRKRRCHVSSWSVLVASGASVAFAGPLSEWLYATQCVVRTPSLTHREVTLMSWKLIHVLVKFTVNCSRATCKRIPCRRTRCLRWWCLSTLMRDRLVSTAHWAARRMRSRSAKQMFSESQRRVASVWGLRYGLKIWRSIRSDLTENGS